MDDGSVAGHRLVSHTADCIIEGWGPDLASCVTQALIALVEEFAVVTDSPSPTVLPVAVSPTGPEDELVALLEEVIYTVDVLSMVPVRFHLAATQDGGLAGDMEVVPLEGVVATGPAPKGVSYHDLSVREGDRGWRCHVLIDV